LKFAIGLCKPGEKIYDICVKADQHVRDSLAKVYQKQKHFKGLAFPTSISVNEICGNYSPVAEETSDPAEYRVLSEGDVAKIDMGVHINGFSAVVAHTIVVSSKNEVVTGKKADVILAAYNALQAAIRTMYIKPENTNSAVTAATKKICDAYKVTPVEGVLSHRMRRDIIDGPEVIINHATYDQKVEERPFDFGDVFGLDVIVTSGEGKPKETELRTTVYKRAIETSYKLKTESGRKLLAVVEQNFHTFPFSFNSFDNESGLKMKQKIVIYFSSSLNLNLFEFIGSLHDIYRITSKLLLKLVSLNVLKTNSYILILS
jgi:curved DNA binding protein